MIDPVVDIVVRCSLALLFATAAYHKLGDFESFRLIMLDYRLLPERAVGLAARSLIAFEAFLAMSLLLNVHRVATAEAAVLLLACYSVAIAMNLLRGRRDIGCGCSGAMHKQLISWWLVLRNWVLLSVGVLLALPLRPRPLGPMDAYTVAIGVMTLALIYGAANRLITEWSAHQKNRRPRSMSTTGECA